MSALIYCAIPAFLLTVALEALWAARARRERSDLRGYEARDTWASLAMGVGKVDEWMAIARDVRRARSLRDALGFVLGPPGWAPGGGQTSRVLRAQAASQGR